MEKYNRERENNNVLGVFPDDKNLDIQLSFD